MIRNKLCFNPTENARTGFILACSDYQTGTVGVDPVKEETLSALLDNINSYITTNNINNIDAVFTCGDYTGGSGINQCLSGLNALKDNFMNSERNLNITDSKFVIVQGNHDRNALNSNPEKFASTGQVKNSANADYFDNFSVFVINEIDYQHNCQPNNRATVEELRDNLSAFLESKYINNYYKPIFILSHVPLHYTMRTYNNGDSRYAKLIFDLLQDYSDKGLNILFLFGHNHSNGWDNYVGGAKVYIEPGEKIEISNPDDNKLCETYICKFTYINAGYVGYVSTTNANDNADKSLTITTYEIFKDHSVIIRRFDTNGLCQIEGIKVPNTRNNNQESILDLYDNNDIDNNGIADNLE